MNLLRRLFSRRKPKSRGLYDVTAPTLEEIHVRPSVWSRDAGEELWPEDVALFGPTLLYGNAMQDAQKMELLRARMGMVGILEHDFNEVAERVIKEARHRDWSWDDVLGMIEAECNDQLYGPVMRGQKVDAIVFDEAIPKTAAALAALPDPQTVPYGTVINGYRAMGNPVRWELYWAEKTGD